MPMRRSPFIKTAFVLAFLLLVIDLGSSPGGDVLALVRRSGNTPIPAPLARRIQVLQELESSWIARIPGRAKPALEAAGFSCEVLDPEPGNKTYFLVFTEDPADAVSLDRFGKAKALDGKTCLFWTDDGREAREVLPAQYEIKSLAPTDRVAANPDKSAATGLPRAPGAVLKPPVYDPLIAGMVGQVSQANLSAVILQLQSFGTRYASSQGCALAGDYLLNTFVQYGLAAEADPFNFSSYSTRNIVATIPGAAFPEYVVLVGAHYDSISNQAAVLAPGADDNASGTAAVVEIARILSQYRFDFTLKFACFGAEEWGLYGSKHYAQQAVSRGEKIIGVLNMDMIAYADRLPEDLDLVVNTKSAWLANRFAICSAQYLSLPPLFKVVNASLRWSDHSPFWDQGYSALCGIEDYNVPNPYYHKTTDVFATLNMDFATSVTRVVLAVAAGLAQVSFQ